MSAAQTTRRAMLGAIGTGAAIATVPALTALAVAPTGASAWAKAFATYSHEEAVYLEWYYRAYAPVQDTLEKAQFAVPHATATYRYLSGDDFKIHDTTITTADSEDVRRARYDLADYLRGAGGKPLGEMHSERFSACQKIVAHADWREAELKRLRIASGIDELDEQFSVIAGRSISAMEAAIQTPVRAIGELVEKVDLIAQEGGGKLEDYQLLAIIAADVRSLADTGALS